jgi:hypothetical protein
MNPPNPVVEIKPYYPTELARMYGIDRKTFRRWLKPHAEAIGEKKGHYFTALQVRIIFEKLGIPGKVKETIELN